MRMRAAALAVLALTGLVAGCGPGPGPVAESRTAALRIAPPSSPPAT